jgi:hypothetical protein
LDDSCGSNNQLPVGLGVILEGNPNVYLAAIQYYQSATYIYQSATYIYQWVRIFVTLTTSRKS